MAQEKNVTMKFDDLEVLGLSSHNYTKYQIQLK